MRLIRFDCHHRSRVAVGLAALMIGLAALPSWSQPVTTGKRIALLVGIGAFKSPNPKLTLEGPANDVVSLRSTLVNRLGVAPADIVTLVDSAATKAAVMAELRRLKQRSAPGDQVIVYFSTHGTSAYDPVMRDAVALPYSSGALVAHDFGEGGDTAGLIVGRTDLLPVFKDLEDSGRNLWVIADSCYSGQVVRSASTVAKDGLPQRLLPAIRKTTDIQTHASGRQPPLPYPYSKVLFLSASAEGEAARDIPREFLPRYPTFDNKPHGAFTDALIRVLEGDVFADYDGNGTLDYAEVHAAVMQFMSDRGYGHVPQKLPALHEDAARLASQPLVRVNAGPSARPRPTGPLRLAVNRLSAETTQALRSVPGVELVAADDRNADLRVEWSQKQADVLEVRTVAGDLITALPPGSSLQAVRGLMAQQVWVRKIRQLGEAGRRALLGSEIVPSHFGGNFLVDEKIAFSIKPDRDARLLLVNIDSLGKVSVLYPYNDAELAPLAANRAVMIPGAPEVDGIKVTEPFGMDVQFVVAFDGDHPELRRLKGLTNVGPDDARLREIEGLLSKATGKFTMSMSELRVVPRQTQ
jgi:hypothetical protein